MRNLTKVLCFALTLVLLLGLVACKPADSNENVTTGSQGESTTAPSGDAGEPEFDWDAYFATSTEIYNAQLGEFYTAYTAAKEATDVSTRMALMAVAEAKLMESAVMLPLSTRGGNYAISRVAPYTINSTLWGNDSDRYHNAIIVNENPLTPEQRTYLKNLWNEKKGTGTYETLAKEYLTAQGYTFNRTYALGYTSDPQTWDAQNTSLAADSEAIVNTYDGLVEYDCENVLQPALAESWTVSDDGLTYTFNIRHGVQWVNSQGDVLCELKASDFVAGMRHVLDAQGGLEYLLEGVLLNASEYIDGTITDFAEVGVKAVDDYTLTYTLTAPTSYFITMLSYNCFAPLCESFYIANGGVFGQDAFAEVKSTMQYGTAPEYIAYCGPYVVSNCTAKNTIVFEKNPYYWNKDNINIDKIQWLFNDGEDTMKSYNDMKANTIAGASLNANALQQAKADKVEGADKTWFEAYTYVSGTDATSYMAFFNLNRYSFANVADGAAVSSQTEAEAARTNVAMQNVHFRRALSYSLDRASYNAQTVGEELKLTSLRNSYTPANFLTLETEVTIKINGTDKTYPAGTYYGKIMQDQIDADGFKVTVYDETKENVGDGYDGWYNPTEAVAELKKAITELQAAGVTVDAEHPIQLDLPTYTGSAIYLNRGNVLKQSLESVLVDDNGKALVNVNLLDCPTAMNWYNSGYYTDYGYEMNYDIFDLSGWGPDYGDAQTYLDTFLPEYAGYMAKCLGIF